MTRTLSKRIDKLEEAAQKLKPIGPIIWDRGRLSGNENRIVDMLEGIKGTCEVGKQHGQVSSLPVPSLISDTERDITDDIKGLFAKHPENERNAPLIIHLVGKKQEGGPHE